MKSKIVVGGGVRRSLGLAVVLAAFGALSMSASASARKLNLTGEWDAVYHCEAGGCAGGNYPAVDHLTQAKGSSVVYDGESPGTLAGNVYTFKGGNPGEYQFEWKVTVSADGKSWSGPLSDSNGTSGTDTAVRVSGNPFEGRASATTISCYVPLLAIGAAWECTATVGDASGELPAETPSGNVSFSVNSGASGGFVGAHECALKSSAGAATTSCTVLFVPASEVPVGGPAPITATYGGDVSFEASSSSASSTAFHGDPEAEGETSAGCSAGAARVALIPSLVRARNATTGSAVITVGNPKLAKKQHTISRRAVDKRAVALLHPSRAGAKSGVRLYGLAKPLAAGATITEATLGLRKAIVKPLKTTEKAWVFWEDLQPSARFEHPSVVLLISANGGRVLARASFVTYPEVNGTAASFVTSRSRRLLVYGRNPGGHRRRRLTKAQLTAIKQASQEARTALRAGKTAHKADASHSKLITIVDHVSGGAGDTFENEESAITYAFAQHGIATQGVLSANALSAAVQSAAGEGKTNVTVYLDGHGASTAATELPTVSLGEGAGVVTSSDLAAIVKAHPEVQFNFIVDSCYSGRFVDPLKAESNVGVVITSSGANETSKQPLSLEHEGGPASESGGRGLVITKEAYGGLVTTGTSKEPGAGSAVTLETPDGEKLAVTNDNSHEGISPFTTGVIAAINQAYVGKNSEADLTDVLSDARTLEPTYDLAATAGLTKPSPEPTAPTPASCPAPDAAETEAGGWFTGE
jgi:hypothetical protein